MNSLRSKKLLILGGNLFSVEIIKQAQSMGIFVVVTDYYEDSPGKKIADKSFMISTTDVSAVVNLINEEHIDGMITGFMDSMLPYYQAICNKAHLPCYATKKQIEIATHKAKFKQLCRDFDIPVVSEVSIPYPFNHTDIEDISYPVLVKPVDHTGAIGVQICESPKELTENYEISLSFSRSNTVLVENYIKAEEVTIFYLIQDGEIYLSSMADRHMTCQKPGILPLPVAYVFPSKYLSKFQETINPNVIKMFKSIGVKNGIIFIQSFVRNGEFIFYEMGYRLTGSLEYKIISRINCVNPMEMMINFALTGSMHPKPIGKFINPNYSIWGCNLTYLIKPGKIGKIIGINEILSLPGVIDVVPAYKEGDVVAESAIGRLQQVVLRVFVATATKMALAKLISEINNTIKVESIDGKNMLLDAFTSQKLIHYDKKL